MRRSIVIISALIVAVAASCKNKIECTVVDASSNEVLEGATIALLNADSTLVGGGVADANGRFSIKTDNSGDYILRISHLGYETAYVNIINLTGDLALGNIAIAPSSTNLKEVSWKGLK